MWDARLLVDMHSLIVSILCLDGHLKEKRLVWMEDWNWIEEGKVSSSVDQNRHAQKATALQIGTRGAEAFGRRGGATCEP